jgi:hypothetical protein
MAGRALYDLTNEYFQILELMEDPEIDREIIQQVLGELTDKIESKAENIAKVIKSIEGDIEVISAEEKRLQGKRRALETNKERLKQYLEEQLELVGSTKVKTPLFSIGIQNNPVSVEVMDENMIPEDFISYTPTINKKDILAQLKEGKEVPGAAIKQTRSLRIR